MKTHRKRDAEKHQTMSENEPKWLPKSIPEASFERPAAPWPGKRQPEGLRGKKKEAKRKPRAAQDAPKIILDDFRTLFLINGEGPAGCARPVKAILAD